MLDYCSMSILYLIRHCAVHPMPSMCYGTLKFVTPQSQTHNNSEYRGLCCSFTVSLMAQFSIILSDES